MADSRFENVLRLEYPLFVKVLNDNLPDNYVEEILKLYNKLRKESYKFYTSIYKTYLDFIIPVNAVYRYLLVNDVSSDDALEFMSEFCLNTINNTLDRLSFIQLAFHYSSNKAYLKLITISSLVSLDAFKMVNDLKEHDMDEELDKSMRDCNIELYLKYYDVEELIKIVELVERSFDMFIDKNVRYSQGEEVILKI